MKEYKDCGYSVREFDSLIDVLNHIKETPDLKEYTMYDSGYLKRNLDFFGCGDIKVALEKLKYGDEKQTSYFKKELTNLDSFEEQNIGIFMDIEGFGYDMGAVVNGEPECCLNSGSPEPKEAINIYVDIGYPGCSKKESINNRGLALVKLVNTLIAKGVIANINMIRYVNKRGELYAQVFRIPTDYLTLATVGYGCANDFYRVIGFLLTAIHSEDKCYSGESTSQPSTSILNKMKERGDLYIPGGYTDEKFIRCNKQQAEDYVFNYYEEFAREKQK